MLKSFSLATRSGPLAAVPLTLLLGLCFAAAPRATAQTNTTQITGMYTLDDGPGGVTGVWFMELVNPSMTYFANDTIDVDIYDPTLAYVDSIYNVVMGDHNAPGGPSGSGAQYYDVDIGGGNFVTLSIHLGTTGADDFLGDTAADLALMICMDGDDEAQGDDNFELIFGGGGDDQDLNGGAGSDEMHGGDGIDIMAGEAGHDLMFSGEGTDNVMAGGDGNDTMFGGAGHEIMEGMTGCDEMYGGAGFDEMGGGDGDDFMRGEAGDDEVGGEDGRDAIDGGEGEDILWGGANDDWIHDVDSASGSEAYGDAGDDIIYIRESTGNNDLADGGAGGDTAYINTGDTPVATGFLVNTALTGYTGADPFENYAYQVLWASTRDCT